MTATDTAQTVKIGSVVTYTGTIAAERGNEFYITEVDDRGRLTITDRWYPTVQVLRQVRPTSVAPTGETLDLCACGHEVSLTLRSDAHFVNEPTVCGACSWACANHTNI